MLEFLRNPNYSRICVNSMTCYQCSLELHMSTRVSKYPPRLLQESVVYVFQLHRILTLHFE